LLTPNKYMKTLAGFSSVTCALFMGLTYTIRKHFPLFHVWYVCLIIIVYITIFTVLFLKLRKRNELNGLGWSYWFGIAIFVIYFFNEILH